MGSLPEVLVSGQPQLACVCVGGGTQVWAVCDCIKVLEVLFCETAGILDSVVLVGP